MSCLAVRLVPTQNHFWPLFNDVPPLCGGASLARDEVEDLDLDMQRENARSHSSGLIYIVLAVTSGH